MHKKIRKFTECFITKISRLRVQCFWFSKSQKGLLFIDYSIRREGTNLPNAFSLKNKAWHGCLIRYKSLECNHFISFQTRQTGTFLIEKYKRTLALPSPQNQGYLKRSQYAGMSLLGPGPGWVIGKMKQAGQGLMVLNCNFKVIWTLFLLGMGGKAKVSANQCMELNKEPRCPRKSVYGTQPRTKVPPPPPCSKACVRPAG